MEDFTLSHILADVLRTSYAARGLTARIVQTGDVVTVENDDCRLTFTASASAPLRVAVRGSVGRHAYYALGLTDERTEGAVSRALDRANRRHDAEQVRYALDAIQAGRGPINSGERSCPRCQGRGFRWDYDDYDGFYALCTNCDGEGNIVIVEPEPREQHERGNWQVDPSAAMP